MTDRLWKKDGKKFPIDKMTVEEVYSATIKCYERMFGNNKRAHYADYRSKTISKPAAIKYWQSKKLEAEYWLEFYSTKLEYVDERAQELGLDLSSNLKELRKEYEDIRKAQQRKSVGTVNKQ